VSRAGVLLFVAAIGVAPAAGQTARPAPVAAGERQRALDRAAAELAAGRRGEAGRLYAQAAERFQSVAALLQLARIQTGGGDRAAALVTLEKASSLAPNSEDVLSGFAQVSLGAGAVTPATVALQNLTRMCPTVAQYHYLLGAALLLAGDMVQAQESLQQADRLEPNKAATLIGLGIALNSRKMFADARPYLLRGLELEPDNIDAVAALAETEEGLGNLGEAESLADRALAKAGDHANANLVKGLVLMQRGEYVEARDAFARSAVKEPDLPKTYYQLSLVSARLGDEANAQKYEGLYRDARRRMEERLEDIRAKTGLPGSGGMRR